MEDIFDSATTTFIGPEDLDGRLILFIPREKGQAKGDSGDMYDYVNGDMLVLDGEPADKIPGPFPFEVIGQRLSAAMIVSQLKPKIPAQKMTLGRVNSRPSKFKKGSPAYSLGDPTDADKALARKYAQPWLDRLAKAAESTDPFAS
jgi:hypothetical protein